MRSVDYLLSRSTVALLCGAAAAQAEPLELQWQAHALQLNGFVLDTTTDVHVAMRTGNNPDDHVLWEDTFVGQPVQNGLVHVVLGSQAALSSEDLPLNGAWMHMTLSDGQTLAPQRIPTAAYAVRAQFIDIRDGVCDTEHVGRIRVDDDRATWLCTPDGAWTEFGSTWEHEHAPFAMSPPTPGSGLGELNGVGELPNGNIASVGYLYLSGIDDVVSEGNTDAYIRVTDPDGVLLWNDTLGDVDTDRFYELAILENGDLVGVGYSESRPYGGVMGRWSSEGTLIATDNTSDIGVKRFSGVCPDGSGGFYASGHADGWYQRQYTGMDATLIRYGADNTRLWTLRHRWPDSDTLTNVAVLPDGNVVIIGQNQTAPAGSTYLGGFNDSYIELIDSDGNVLAHRQFGTADYEYMYGLAIRDDGLIAISGHTGGAFEGNVDTAPGLANGFVAVLNADLSTNWVSQLPSAGLSTLSAVAWDNSGRLHAVGSLDGGYGGAISAGARDQLHVIYSDTGVELFSQQNGSVRNDAFNDIAIARDNDVLLVGSQYFNGSQPQGDVQRRANLP